MNNALYNKVVNILERCDTCNIEDLTREIIVEEVNDAVEWHDRSHADKWSDPDSVAMVIDALCDQYYYWPGQWRKK